MHALQWPVIFHNLIIPFLGGLTLTLLKSVADQKLISFDDANGIALDMVLIGVGALGAFYIKSGAVDATIDAGVGDSFLAAILLYIRYQRRHRVVGNTLKPVRPFSGIVQLILGAGAILWTIKAF